MGLDVPAVSWRTLNVLLATKAETDGQTDAWIGGLGMVGR